MFNSTMICLTVRVGVVCPDRGLVPTALQHRWKPVWERAQDLCDGWLLSTSRQRLLHCIAISQRSTDDPRLIIHCGTVFYYCKTLNVRTPLLCDSCKVKVKK